MLYLPSLDGLRLIAFLLVFFHHLPQSDTIPGLRFIHRSGWVGVELFFVISAFLFFHLFKAENARTGHIDIRKFYTRRLLRIYPLMALFAVAMFCFGWLSHDHEWWRLISLLTVTDNIATAVTRQYSPIPYAGQLWTLGFELQIYLVIPFLFLFYRQVDTQRFCVALAVIWGVSAILRVAIVLAGARHLYSATLVVWTLPVFRPDTVLLGVLLAIGAARLPNRGAFAIFLISFGLFFGLGELRHSKLAIIAYPLAAVMCGSLVSLALNQRAWGRVLSVRPLAFAGTISFGLYVYHVLGIAMASRFLQVAAPGFNPSGVTAHYLAQFGLAGLFTVLMAWASYHVIESPFLRLKDRFAIVRGRDGEQQASPPEAEAKLA